jgi:hypothetical protein
MNIRVTGAGSTTRRARATVAAALPATGVIAPGRVSLVV